MLKPLNTLSNTKLLVSPSVLASDFAKLGAELQSITNGGADMVHLDVMDAHFVPNLTIGPTLVGALRGHTDLPFDVHLMITNPLAYVEPFFKAGADHITFHVESDDDPQAVIDAIHALGMSAGITLKPGTPVDTLLPFMGQVEMFLVMTVEPGFGGQKFMPDQLEKVRILRREIKLRGLNTHIEVDGGLKAANVEAAATAGANVIVAGTSVFRHPNGHSAGIQELHAAQGFLS